MSEPRVWECEGDWHFLDDHGMPVNCNSKIVAEYLTDIQDGLITMRRRIEELTEEDKVEFRRLLGAAAPVHTVKTPIGYGP